MADAPPFLSRATLLREKVPDWDVYPFTMPMLQKMDAVDFHPVMTFLVGENGAGKSTLLEAFAICCGFNPEGGSKNFSFSTHSSHSDLHQFIRIAKSGNAERNLTKDRAWTCKEYKARGIWHFSTKLFRRLIAYNFYLGFNAESCESGVILC